MSEAKNLPEFRIGDTVVEPTLGICNIEGVRKMTVDGVEEIFFIFEAGNAKVMVPQSQLPKRGIRRPMTREEVKKIFTMLKQPVSPSRGDARTQYLNYREILKSGNPQKITKLLRDLYTLDQSDELKGKEKEIMERAKKFLVDEITFVREASKTKTQDEITENLRQMYKRKVTKEKEKPAAAPAKKPAQQ
ncbi:MAG: RNA polymerase-binding transcription factor CarD [candidate division BRC1 bacterium ADurb.BinA364]|nr:MAG: RNA polymerase-binding transcription factor CarD [candidate division BRC1 bacterium ADurb.BinA364]